MISNINVKKVTHCVSNYAYPPKSPCHLNLSCKNVFHFVSQERSHVTVLFFSVESQNVS